MPSFSANVNYHFVKNYGNLHDLVIYCKLRVRNLAGGMFSVLSLINTLANGYCCEAIASNTYRTQDAPRYAIGRQFVILRLQHMTS